MGFLYIIWIIIAIIVIVLLLKFLFGLFFSVGLVPVLQAASYLKIHTPDTGQQVPAGQFYIVTGSSLPSNATRTHCTVTLQTNQHGYMPVTGLGPAGTYTKWEGRTSEPVKVGPNQVEGQFQCFPAASLVPNFTKHLVHNFTGVPTTPLSSGMGIINTTQQQAGMPPLLK